EAKEVATPNDLDAGANAGFCPLGLYREARGQLIVIERCSAFRFGRGCTGMQYHPLALQLDPFAIRATTSQGPNTVFRQDSYCLPGDGVLMFHGDIVHYPSIEKATSYSYEKKIADTGGSSFVTQPRVIGDGNI